MAYKDPWLGVTWKVYAVQGTGGGYLKPAGKEGSFTLSAVQDGATGKTAYYVVYFPSGNMPPCWQGILLYPRGEATFPPPVPVLQPWTLSGDAPWLAAANAVREDLNDTKARLEGSFSIDANSLKLTLVCVSNATTTGTPLLVLKLANPTGSLQPLANPGGGHGDN